MMRRVYNKGILFLTLVMALAALVLYVHTAFAQPNLEINYQGKLTDSSSVAVTDGEYNMRFFLYNTTGGATTTNIWTEEWLVSASNGVQVTNGLFSTMLGSTTAFTGVDFNQTLYLGVEIGGTGSSPTWDGEMTPRKVLGTVPAAFEAQQLDGLATTSFLRSDQADTLQATESGTLLTLIQDGTGAIFDAINASAESVFKIFESGVVTIGTSTADNIATTTGLAVVNKDVEVVQGVLTQIGAISVDGADGFPNDIEVVGDIMYLATTWQSNLSFESYDISDPANPVFLDAVNTSGFNTSYNISVSGNYAYVTGGSGTYKLYVVDITNPSSMEVVGGYAGSDQFANSNQLVGNYLYLADSDTVYVLNVSDPLNPVLEGTTALGSNQTNHIQVLGDRLYVMPGIDGGLSIYDISNPASTTYIGGDSVSGSPDYHFFVENNIAYSITSADLVISNVSDPNSFTELSTLSISGTDLRNEVKKFGNYVFLGGVSDSNELVVVDVSDTANPFVVDQVNYGATDIDVESIVVVDGRYLYVATDNDIDAGNDLFIYELASVITPTANIGNLVSNDIESDYLRVTEQLTADGSLNVGTNALIGGALTITGTASSSLQSTNTNPALTVTSGYVGIGTTTPYQDLSIDGDVALTGALFDNNASSGESGYVLQSTGSGLAWVATSTLGFAADGGGSSLFTDDGDITYLTSLTDVLAIGTSTDVATSTGLAVYNRDVEVLIGTGTPLVARDSILENEDGATELNTPLGFIVRDGIAYVNSFNDDGIQILDVSDPDNIIVINNVSDGTNGLQLDGPYNSQLIGNYLYVTVEVDDLVQIIDVSNPTDPQSVGTISSSSEVLLDLPRNIEVRGSYAYVTSDVSDGLQVLDVSNPVAPVALDSISPGFLGPRQMVIDGNYAYIASNCCTNDYIIDISDPTNLRLASTLSNGATVGVAVVDNYAYYSLDAGGLVVVDVTDPNNPSTITTIADGANGANFSDGGRLKVVGNYMLLGSEGDDAIQVYDISSSTNPVGAGAIVHDGVDVFLDRVFDLQIEGNLVYTVSNNSNAFQIFDLGGLITPTANIGNLLANDIESNFVRVTQSLIADSSLNVGTNARIGGTLTVTGTASSTLQGDITQAALAVVSGAIGVGTSTDIATSTGLAVYNKDVEVLIGTSSDPFSLLGGIDVDSTSGGISDIFVANDLAYVTSDGAVGDNFDIYDISDPANIQSVGSVDVGQFSSASRVWVSGNYAYVTSNGGSAKEFEVVDVSNPAAPVVLGGIDFGQTGLHVKVFGRYAFVGVSNTADTQNELEIIDISDPANLVRIDGIDYGGNSATFDVSNNFLYILSGPTNELEIWDLADMGNIYQIGGTDTISGFVPYEILVEGNYAYITSENTDGVLQVFDVSDPANPAAVGEITVLEPQENFSGGIAKAGDYLFVGETDVAQILMFDVSDPANPALAAESLVLTSAAEELFTYGDKLFVARDDTSGDPVDLQIYKLPTLITPTAEIGNLLAGDIETDYLRVTQALLADGSLNVATDALVGGTLTVVGNASSSLQGDTTQAALAVMSGAVGVGTTTDIATSTGLAVYNKDVEILQGAPVKVGGVDLSDTVRDLTVVGDYVYTLGQTGASEFKIIDVSDPAAPALVNSHNIAGQGNEIKIAGNYAYIVSRGDELEVIDISNPNNLITVATVALGDVGEAIWLDGRYAYVGTDAATEELQIFDISDPTNPVKVSTLDRGNGVNAIVVDGNFLYAGLGSSGSEEVEIIDVSDPTNPVQLSGVDNDVVNGAAYADGHFFVAANSNFFEAFDVSDPGSISGTDSISLDAIPSDVDIAASYAYVVSGSTGNDIHVIDISDPTNLVEIASVAIEDGIAANAVEVQGGYLYVGSANGTGADLEIYKLPSLITPTAEIGNLLANTIETDYFRVSQALSVDSSLNVGANAMIDGVLTVVGNASSSQQGDTTQAALAVSSGALAIGTSTNISTTTGLAVLNKDIDVIAADPIARGQIVDNGTTALLNGAYVIEVRGDYAYVGGRDGTTGLQILDISDPDNPVAVGSLADDGTTLLGSIAGIAVQGNYAYIGSYSEDGVQVVDISDPSNPVGVGNIADGTNGATELNGARWIEVDGRYAYVASFDDNGVQILDISDPTQPIGIAVIEDEVDGATELANANVLTKRGDYLYVASWSDNGGQIFDVSDPYNPVALGVISVASTQIDHIELDGNHLYIAGSNQNTVSVVDVSDPNNVTSVGSITDGTSLDYPRGLAVVGDYLLVPTYDGDTLTILDISDPANMVVAGSVADAGVLELEGASRVAVQGKYAYVVSRIDDGLQVIELPGLITPTAEIGNLLADSIETDFLRVTQALVAETSLNVGTNALVGGAVSVVGTEFDAELAQGLVAHYTFDVPNIDLSSTTGEILDISGNGNTADWQDHSTTTVAGIIRQAIEFDGAGGESAEFNREQSDFSSESNPATATFGATPTEGNLLVVTALGRSGTAGASYSIDGTGWTKVLEQDTELTETFGRRSLNIWTKTAGAAEPTAIQVDAGETIKVLVEEFSASTTATWEFRATSSADTAMTEPTTLSTGATASVDGPNLLVMGRGAWRDAPSGVSWTNSLTDQIESLGGRSIVSAYKTDDTTGTKESTVNWTTNRKANAAIVVYQAVTSGGSGSTIDAGNIGSGIQTISFWVNADTAADTGLISVDGTDVIETNASNEVVATSFPGATVYIDGGTATTAIAEGSWSHVTITDSTGVNGSAFEIGTDGTEFFDGKIDNVRVYDRALSASEVERLYQLGASSTNPAVNVTSGYVGVGTTSPYAALSITGNLAVVGGLYDNTASLGTAGYILESTGSGFEWIATSTITPAGASFFTDGGDITYLTSLTDVLAIGTTTDIATSTGLAVYNRDIEIGFGSDAGLIPLDYIQDGDDGLLMENPDQIIVRGDYAYVVDSTDDRVNIFDVSDPNNITLVSAIADGSNGANDLQQPDSMALVGNYLYVTSEADDAVQVIDVSNPTSPVGVSSISSTTAPELDGAEAIVVRGSYAYVMSGDSESLIVLDISDPTNLIPLGSHDAGANVEPNDIKLRGDYLYTTTSCCTEQLIFDISDPLDPRYTGFLSTNPSNSSAIAFKGNTAYYGLGSGGGIQIVDMTDPENPSTVTTIADGTNGLDYISAVRSLEIAGDYMFVAAFNDDAIQVLDISSSTNPVSAGFILHDNVDVFLDQAEDLAIQGDKLYVVSRSSDALQIFDLPGLITPTAEIGNIFANNIEVDYMRVTQAIVTDSLNVGTDAFIGGSFAVTGSASSSLQGTTTQAAVAVTGGAVGIGVTNNIATSTGLAVYNKDVDVVIGTGTPLWGVGSVTSTNDVFDTIFDVEVRGDLAYLVGRDFNVDGGMSIVDVSDPTNPTILSTITDGVNDADTLGEARRITLSGNYAYVSSGDSGLLDYGVQVIDISDPTNPIGVGSIRDGSATAPNLANPLGTVIDGRYMYVAVAGDDSVQVLDISDPTNPVGVSSITHNGTSILLDGVGNLVLEGNYLYANSFVGDTFQIIDVSDPTNLVALGNVADNTGGANDLNGPSGLVLSGNYVYVAAEVDNAIQILDISDPSNVSGAGSITDGTDGALLDTPISLVRSGNYLFVTVRTDNAIQILDISSSTNPVPAGVIIDGTYNANELASPRDIAVQGNYLYVSSVDDDALQILSLDGLTAPTANIGNLASDNIESDYLRVTQTLYAETSLNVGTNALVNGAVSITGNASSSLLSGNTNVALLVESGNFGIGTSSPFAEMSVDGDVALTGGLYDSSASLGTSGQVLQSTGSGVQWVSTSSLNIVGGGSDLFTDGGDITYLTSLTDVLAIGTTTDIATTTGLAVYNRDVEVLAGSDGLQKVGSIDIGSSGVFRSIDVIDDVAYLYGNGPLSERLFTFDVSDPSNIKELGSVSSGDTTLGGRDSVVVGNYLYGIEATGGNGNGNLNIFDVTNPTAPVQVGTSTPDDAVITVDVQGNRAYTAGWNGVSTNNLTIYDISNPADPYILGGIDVDQNIFGIKVKGRYAYIGGNQRFFIYDVSDPSNIVEVGQLFTSSNSHGAPEIVGRYAYTDCSLGVCVIDISDVTAPTLVTSVTAQSDADEVVVAGDYLVSVGTDSGDEEIILFDISSSTNPIKIASDSSVGAMEDVVIVGQYAYVTGDFNGDYLHIYKLPTLTTPTAEIGNLLSDDIETSYLTVTQALRADSLNVNTNAMVGGALTITGTASSSLISSNSNTALTITSGFVQIGTSTNATSGIQIGYGAICVDNDGACTASTTGRISSVSTYSGNSDLAETYFSADDLSAGDIVTLEENLSVSMANRDEDKTIIGVVSTKPGVLLGFDDVSLEDGEVSYPIALKGRVPVKVTTENGPINPGDQLMLSSIPGMAMKATGTGAVVGIALEAFDPDESDQYFSDTFINQFTDDLPSTEDVEAVIEELTASTTETIALDNDDVQQGQIVMFVELSYRYIDEQTNQQLTTLMEPADDADDTIFDRITNLAKSFVGGVLSVFEIKTGTFDVNDTLCIDGVCIDEGELQILIDSLDEPGESQPDTDPPPDIERADEEEEENQETSTSTPDQPEIEEPTATTTETENVQTEEISTDPPEKIEPATESENTVEGDGSIEETQPETEVEPDPVAEPPPPQESPPEVENELENTS